jgi:uncharacterized membrane protein
MRKTHESEIDWKEWRTNIILLLMISGIGFLLSSGNPFVAIFIFMLFAPLYRWRKEKVTEEQVRSKPLSEVGKESLQDHLVEIGQISDKS